MMRFYPLAGNTDASSFSTFLSHCNPISCLDSLCFSLLCLLCFAFLHAIHSRFANVSKFMIFLFPCIWLFFPTTSCYCDALDLKFFLSALFYSSYDLLIFTSLFFYPSHHNTNCIHSIFTGVLQPFIFVVFSYILREYSPLDRRLLRHLCSADQHWQLLNCSDMEIW